MKPLVAIKCITYNHKEYIRDCLEGIVMQKTNFPFVAIVHDDASTDGTAEIILEYAEKYPDIIKPVIEKENLYSQGVIKLRQAIDCVCNQTQAKYMALCEGDDYWTDPLKLQKQVDFMERHPDYSLHFHNAAIYNQKLKTITGYYNRYNEDTEVSPEDIIKGGGGFCPSCSILYRASFMSGYPQFCSDFIVGDYPLQIYLASKGKVCYSNEIMGTYRIQVPGSWSSTVASKCTNESHLKRLSASLEFLETFDSFTNFKYHEAILDRKNSNVRDILISNGIYPKNFKYIARNPKERLNVWLIRIGYVKLKRWIKRYV